MLTDDNAPDRVPGRREPSSPICATSYFAELAADSYGTGSEAAPLVLVHGLTYDRSTWDYEESKPGEAANDLSLEHPRSVFQLLRRHYSRYTPEMVERITGVPKDQFLKAADLFTSVRKDGA